MPTRSAGFNDAAQSGSISRRNCAVGGGGTRPNRPCGPHFQKRFKMRLRLLRAATLGTGEAPSESSRAYLHTPAYGASSIRRIVSVLVAEPEWPVKVYFSTWSSLRCGAS